MEFGAGIKIILVLVVLSSLFACFSVPAYALENDGVSANGSEMYFTTITVGENYQKLEHVLVNGSGMYLTTGETWSFYQGYELIFKGLSSSKGENKVWIEFLLNGESIDSMIMNEGENFVYTRNSKEVFNVTADTIYSGPDGGLVTFKPVYQYLDSTLPEPDMTQDYGLPDNSNNLVNNSTISSEARNISGIGAAMLFLCISAAAIYMIRKNR